MFDSLQKKLEKAFQKIRGRSVVSEADIAATMKDVRLALLEADVNFKVARDFCDKVAQASVGEDILKSLSPDQQIIKIVHERLVQVMGESSEGLSLNVAPPAVIMLVGLQGSGKTTTASKLALLLKTSFIATPSWFLPTFTVQLQLNN